MIPQRMQAIEEIGLNEIDPPQDGMFLRIASSHLKCGRGDIRCHELRLRQLFGQGDGDAAGAGTDVGDEEAGAVVFVGATGAEFAESEAVESDFDKVFGLGAGNQDVGSNFERKAPEFLFAGEMLHGNARDAPVEKILIRERFFGREFGFGMGVNVGTFALSGVEEEQFGGERVRRDVGGAKLGDAVFEGGAKKNARRFR